jgi:Zn-dependent peptidase ImmA (M78 family)
MTVENKFSKVADLFSFLKEQHSYDVTVPVDVNKIANLLGIVVEEDFCFDDQQFIGQISFDGDRPKITINVLENTYEPRKRFTLAHELAHYCLHSNDSKSGFVDTRKTMDRSGSYWDVYESEANSFAARLLMPKPLLISEGNKVINEYQNEIDRQVGMPQNLFVDSMAKKFNVSNAAMEYRLRNLGIIKSKR